MMLIIAQVVFLISAILLTVIILLQQSKSSGMGSAMGGASSTVFGAKGAGSFLYKTTRALAIVFFVSALWLSFAQNKAVHQDKGILENNPALTDTLPSNNSVGDIPQSAPTENK